MERKFTKSTIRDLIKALGFEKAFDFIRENAPDSLILPNPQGLSDTQGNLFEDDTSDKPLEQIIAELDEFFDITSEDLMPRPGPRPTIPERLIISLGHDGGSSAILRDRATAA
jgi:hypothetical protein